MNNMLREPVKDVKISQEFGKDFQVWDNGKQIYFYKDRYGLKGHPGRDYACPIGTPIYSMNDGVCLYAGFDNTNGNLIQIWNEKENYKTLYGHCSAFKVKQGDVIKQGDLIALSGNTGASTGPHIHVGYKQTIAGGNTKFPNNGYNGAEDFKHLIISEDTMKFKKIKGEPSVYLVDDVKGTMMMIIDMETLTALDGEIIEVDNLAGYVPKGTLIWTERIIN